MARKFTLITVAMILLSTILFGAVFSGTAQQAVNSTFLPLIRNHKTRQLTVCMAQEPDSLYLYNSNTLASTNVRQAIYDGPMDSNTYASQPVILIKIPSLADADAIISPLTVHTGDAVVDSNGNPTTLEAGSIVRPAGCRSNDCAITFDGVSPLQMDQMSVTFQLLPNLHWSDGTPLTASDSVYSFNLAADPETPTYKYVIERTSSYTATSNTQTVWKGLTGYLDTSYYVNFWQPLPEHIWGSYSALELLTADISSKKPMGWGPYIVDEWIPGVQITLLENQYYFRHNEGLPKFTKLVFRFTNGDVNEAIAAILAGDCDIVDQTTSLFSQAQLLLNLESAGLINAAFSTGTAWEHVDFNIQPVESIINTGVFAGWDVDGNGDGPFGDVRLRQAIAMCMDRQAVIDTALFGQTEMMDSYVPYNHPLYDPAATHWPYDPTAAAALLDEIGWLDSDNDPGTSRVAQGVTGVPENTPLYFNYETTTASLRQQVTQMLAQNLADCGIQVNLWYHPPTDWFAAGPDGRLYGRKYDLGEFLWITGGRPPCDIYLSNRVPREENGWSGSNTAGFHDPSYDAACNTQIQSLPGEADYEPAVKEAQRIFAEQIPVIPLFLRYMLAATRPDMCNFIMDPTAVSELWNIENFNYGTGCLK